MPNKYYEFDSRLEHRAALSAALTATTTLGTITQKVAMRTEFVTKLVVESIDITSNNELYQVVIEVTNDDFATVETAAIRDLGATEVRTSGAPDSAVGDDIEIEWSTEVNNVGYRDTRIQLVIAGTTPSIAALCYSGRR